jgi:hypothetical protein
VRPVLFTTSSLSAEASRLLKQHNVGLRERYTLQPYPTIKCYNDPKGKKLYVTPACYTYDSIRFHISKGDLHLRTEDDAIAHGFSKQQERVACLASAAKRSSSVKAGAHVDAKLGFWRLLKAWVGRFFGR